MMLVIDTQDRENYAAHQGFNGEYRWKMKGGSEYKVKNVPLNIDHAAVVEMAAVEHDNEYTKETIVDWSIEADDYLSWFEKSQLEYEGAIVAPEPILDYNELNEAVTC
jgi:hypothetical protein